MLAEERKISSRVSEVELLNENLRQKVEILAVATESKILEAKVAELADAGNRIAELSAELKR
jgi:hypothetical protein